MERTAARRILRRHKEVVLLLAALLVGAAVISARLSGWVERERWDADRPITVREAVPPGKLPTVTLTDFDTVWQAGGRNPFGDAAVALESGGKAKLPPPPLPPLRPEMPPVPRVRPIDLLTGGG
jgi:hypothetical protein